MSLQLPGISSISNDELYGLGNDLKHTLQETYEVVPAFAGDYLACLNGLRAALEPNLDENLNKLLSNCDVFLDKSWVNLRAYLKACLNHPDQAVREAALVLYNLIEPSDNPTSKPYNVECGILERIVDRLHKVDARVVALVHAEPWIQDLSSRMEEFISIYQRRLNEPAKSTGVVKNARTELLASLREFIENVNAMNRLSPSPELSAFMEKCEKIFEEMRMRQKMRRTRTQNASSKTSAAEVATESKEAASSMDEEVQQNDQAEEISATED